MKLTKMQHKKLGGLIPIARKQRNISNYKLIYMMLYVIENGCKWRVLPKEYGK